MDALQSLQLTPDKCSQSFLHLMVHVFDQLDTMAGVLDLEGRILYVNRNALKIINVSHSEIIGSNFLKSPWRAYSKESIALTKKMMIDALAGKVSLIEDFIVNRNGQRIPTLFSISPVHDTNGKIIALMPEAKIISTQKMLQAKIKEEQWETQQWIDSMGAYVAKCDKEGRLISCNQPFLNAMNISLHKIAGEYICDTVWLGHSSKTQKKLQRAIKNAGYGQRVSIEVKLSIGGGKSRTSLFTVSPILNSAGNVAFLALEIIDISEQVRLRELMIASEKEYSNRLKKEVNQVTKSLRETELFNETLIKAAPVGVLYLDEDDRLMFVNPEMKNKLEKKGILADSVKGKRLPEFGICMTDSSWRKIKGIKKQKICLNKMKMVLSIEGENDLLFDVSAASLSSSIKDIKGTVLIMDDVTERNRLEEELLRTRIQSEKMSSLKLFISGIAHELNNPLTSIIGCAEHLEEDSTLAGESVEAARIIVDDARRAGKIVKNLSDFAGKDMINANSVDLNESIRKVIDIRLHELKKRNIELILELDSGPKIIAVSATEIQQVLLNLLRNAVNAIEESGTGTLIIIRTFMDGNNIILEIEDNGPGIPDDCITKIFDPFFTTRQKQKGSGLGLSIVHGIIQKSGGVISMYTSDKTGTKFKIKFPTLKSSAPLHLHSDKLNGFTLIPSSVLVVDDEPHVGIAILKHLSIFGCKVDSVQSGQEALKKIKAKEYDLLLVNMRMPEMSGFDLYKEIRSLYPEYLNRFAFMTGFFEHEKKEIIRSLGIHVLQKPFSKIDLIRFLQQTEKTISV